MEQDTLYRIIPISKSVIDVSGITIEQVDLIKHWFRHNGFDITKPNVLNYALSKPITFQPIMTMHTEMEESK
jgi:hypothetical protein